MKICLLSDLHGHLPQYLPEHELLIISGDICPLRDHSLLFQRLWLNDNFKPWVQNITNGCVGCWGNHDFIGEKLPNQQMLVWKKDESIPIRLESKGNIAQTIIGANELVKVKNYKIWLSAYQLPFYDWAFNLTEDELAKKYSAIPVGTDIIVSHGPPYGYGDTSNYPNDDGDFHCGSKSLLAAIDRVKPKLVVFGHIHDGYGAYDHNGIKLVNASYVDNKYKPVNKPIVVEV